MTRRPTPFVPTSFFNLLLLGTSLAMGCASPAVGTQGAGIFQGQPAPADTMVVAVMPGCTGTLIAPNVVLTAHHCVAKIDLVPDCTQSMYRQPSAASSFSVSTAPTIDSSSRGPHQILQVLPLPDQPEPERLCGDDLALLVLDSPIPATEATPAVPRVDEVVGRGEAFSAVGFGATDNATPRAVLRTRRRRDAVSVQCVGAACPSDVNGVQSREWVGEDESCAGDSGGAALDTVGRLIGVHNRGANVMVGEPDTACSGTSIYNQIWPHASWLKSEVARVSMDAGLTPPPWSTGYPTDPKFAHPIGAMCARSEDCPSGKCVDKVCSRECNAAAPCPTGYACEIGTAVCAPVQAEGCAISADIGTSATTRSLLVALAALAFVVAAARRRSARQ